MSMLENRKAYLPLVHNQKYQAVLRTYQEYEPTEESKATNPDRNGFIVFKFIIQEDGREISDTRSFPAGTDILSRQLLTQTGLPNATDQIALFRHCIENQTVLNVWVTTNGEYTNYTFVEPQASQPAGVPAPVDTKDFE
jgi:hypothetical protein